MKAMEKAKSFLVVVWAQCRKMCYKRLAYYPLRPVHYICQLLLKNFLRAWDPSGATQPSFPDSSIPTSRPSLWLTKRKPTMCLNVLVSHCRIIKSWCRIKNQLWSFKYYSFVVKLQLCIALVLNKSTKYSNIFGLKITNTSELENAWKHKYGGKRQPEIIDYYT